LVGWCLEIESWLLKAAKKDKAFCLCLINICYRFLLVFWKPLWAFAAQKARCGSLGWSGQAALIEARWKGAKKKKP
jgi:hypothetical protein